MMIEINHKKIFAFADTHGKHRQLNIPANVDILVFAGDACEAGDQDQLTDFFAWFAELPAQRRLFVPGNHDLPFEFNPYFAKKMVPKNIKYVESGGFILCGIRFFVLPVRPWLHSEELVHVPSRVDVLVTHGAPSGIFGLDALDKTFSCPILRGVVNDAQPKIHIFGHIHQHGGQSVQIDKTLFCNVAVKM